MRGKFQDGSMSLGHHREMFRTNLRTAFFELYLKEWRSLNPDAPTTKPKKYQSRVDALMRVFSDDKSFPEWRNAEKWEKMMASAGFDSNEQAIFRLQVCPFKFVLHSNRNT
jgi:hypothetical protein